MSSRRKAEVEKAEECCLRPGKWEEELEVARQKTGGWGEGALKSARPRLPV
jgi:hypothetical protein